MSVAVPGRRIGHRPLLSGRRCVVPLNGHIEGKFPPRHRHEQLTGRFTNLSAFEHQACEGIVNIVRGEHNRSIRHP
jgi:hypothetical protein